MCANPDKCAVFRQLIQRHFIPFASRASRCRWRDISPIPKSRRLRVSSVVVIDTVIGQPTLSGERDERVESNIISHSPSAPENAHDHGDNRRVPEGESDLRALTVEQPAQRKWDKRAE